MAMRCFGRARLAVGNARALVLRTLALRFVALRSVALRSAALRSAALIVFRAVDLAAGFRAGDFFCAAVRLAARDVGFCLAIRCLPEIRRTRLSDAPPGGG